MIYMMEYDKYIILLLVYVVSVIDIGVYKFCYRYWSMFFCSRY